MKIEANRKKKGHGSKSSREPAKNLIDQIPEETPNAETLEAIQELENGGGTVFTSSTEDLFAELMEG